MALLRPILRQILAGLPRELAGWSLDLDFAGTESVDPRVTFTRASSAMRTNASGVFESVGVNVPRIDYDPVTLQCRGFLREESRTNLLLNSETLVTQSITVTAAKRTLSFYGSGTVVMSGAHAATLVGVGAYPARKIYTYTPSAGVLTLTVTGEVKFANDELGESASTWIPTTGAAATRSADLPTISGANFSDWYNQSEGTFLVEFDFEGHSGSDAVISAYDTAQTNTYSSYLYFNSTNSNIQAYTAISGTTQGAIVLGVSPDTYPQKIAHAYKTDAFGASMNGGAVVADSIGSAPSSINALALGTASTGSNPMSGHYRRLTYFPKRLPNSTLQMLSRAP